MYKRQGSKSNAFVVRGNGNIGINDDSPAALFTVYNGTTDGQMTHMKNDEVGLFLGAYGTGSSYPREVTINGSRIDSGSLPFLRVAGQGGIRFCVDLNNERVRIDSAGMDVTGAITADDLRTDNSQTLFLTSASDFRFRGTGGSERCLLYTSPSPRD